MAEDDKQDSTEQPEPEDEDTQRKRIEELLEQGYTPIQIEKEWGYPHSTVRSIAKKRISPKGVAQGAKEDKQDESRLPIVLKTGKGQEVITPEGIMQYYLVGDGNEGVAMLKGMMLLRAAQLMVMNDVEIMKGQADAQATAIKPILDIMEKAREDMDAAAERARASTEDVAQAAAAGAAARATMHIDERFEEMMRQKTDIAQTPNPLEGVMARTMETVFNQLTNRMLGGQGGQGGQLVTTPGFVDKRGG